MIFLLLLAHYINGLGGQICAGFVLRVVKRRRGMRPRGFEPLAYRFVVAVSPTKSSNFLRFCKLVHHLARTDPQPIRNRTSCEFCQGKKPWGSFPLYARRISFDTLAA